MKAVKEIERKYYKYGNTINAVKVGNPTVNNGVVSGFGTSKYLTTNITLPSSINIFEIQFKFTTGSTQHDYTGVLCTNTTDNNVAQGFRVQHSAPVEYSSDNQISLSFHDTNYFSVKAIQSPALNTTYWTKWIFDGSSIKGFYSLDGKIFTLTQEDADISKYITAMNKFNKNNAQYFIGIFKNDNNNIRHEFTGSIDLKQCYIKINDKEIWHGTFAEESTESDYDFYKDVPVYKAIKENDIYKAPRSWEKGQYYGN